MFRRVLPATAIAIALACGLTTLAAQQGRAGGQRVSDTAQTPRGTEDTNIKTKQAPNDPAKDTPAPANKGGEKTRAAACIVNFDNYTPWFIEMYVDGNFAGIVGPWDDVNAIAGNGPTVLYARANFRDGSFKYWGPRSMNCVPGGFTTWELHR
jgi:hypothetical protein